MKKSYLFTGGYNRNNSEGITVFLWENEELAEVCRRTDTQNPSYLAFHPVLPVVYAAGELPERAEITAYRIASEDMELLRLNSGEAPGADLCHICVSPDGKAVYGANYTSGSIIAFSLEQDASVGQLLSDVRHSGSGPHPRQAGAHAHQVVFDPWGVRLIAVDFGADAIFSYMVGERGEILEDSCVKCSLPAGEGPRHMVFSSSGEEACVISELGCKLLRCRYEKETGRFFFEEALSLWEGAVPKEVTGGELVFLPGKEMLYASLRGEDKIHAVKWERDRALRRVGDFPVLGRCPRMFSADSEGRYLFIANQVSGTLHAVALHQETGLADRLCCTRTVAEISFAQPY